MGGIANTPENSFTVRLRPGFGREAFTGPELKLQIEIPVCRWLEIYLYLPTKKTILF